MKKVVNDKQTGKFAVEISCDSCQLIRINGLVCHETGCPNAWKDTSRECKECGTEFQPQASHEKFCSHSCESGYYGGPCNCDECMADSYDWDNEEAF